MFTDVDHKEDARTVWLQRCALRCEFVGLPGRQTRSVLFVCSLRSGQEAAGHRATEERGVFTVVLIVLITSSGRFVRLVCTGRSLTTTVVLKQTASRLRSLFSCFLLGKGTDTLQEKKVARSAPGSGARTSSSAWSCI
eukprot:scaffold1596_cov302-Pinguiococcus_pyrenoidosus.AAC.80